jgi:tetratricopeptide (TPR) repeat protein
VIVAKGPGIRPGARLRGASILDVAPTILARLGIPAGEDMGGRVLHELWASPPTAALERIPTHDRPGWREETFVSEAAEAGAAAQALASRLRALGYLGPGQGAAEGPAQVAIEQANLAGYHLQRGELEPALAAAKRSAAEDPGNYEAFRHLAALYRRIGDRRAALAAIDTAIAIREGAVEPRLYRVELLRESGAPEEAKRAAASLVERHPRDPRAHNLLGRLHAEAGEVEPAIRSYRSSLALDPDQEAASVELLSLLIAQGDAGEIDRFLAERESAGPGGLDRWLALAKAYLRRRDLESALRFAELSLRDRPGAKEGYLCRGIVLGERREYARSVADFDRALALDPDYVEAHFNAGVTHLKAGDPARAVASLEAAAALLPSSDPILANLGKAYALAGDAERARRALAEALRINPASEMARAYQAQVAAGEGSRVPERGDAP